MVDVAREVVPWVVMFEVGVVESRSRSGGCGSGVLDAQHQNQLKPVLERKSQTKMESNDVYTGGPVVQGPGPVVPVGSSSLRSARARPLFPPIHDFLAKSREIG